MNSQKVKSACKKYILITIGIALYSVGISLLLDPNNLAPGGVTGISIILSRLTPIATGTWILLINSPLLIIGWIRFGSKMMVGTVYATVLTSLFTNILSVLEPLSNELLASALLGSLCVGTGIGIVFRAGATTGGMDIVVKLLRQKYPHMKSGTLFLMLDMAVVVTSGFMFRNLTLAVYAGMVVFLNARIMDTILYGQDEARLIYIISDRPEEIATRLLANAFVGVTYLEGAGAYTARDKQIIMCATRKQQAVRVVDIVKEEDENAFLIITSASEVFGKGYKNIHAERL